MIRVVALVMFATLALQTSAVGSGAEARANAWLQAHSSQPDMGDLSDFAKSDPNGFALVKALMLKRSLGLLDPRKPTASFAAPVTHESDDDKPVGAAAFGQFAAPGELEKHAANAHAAMVSEVSNTEEDVPAPVSHSSAHSFAWKPNNDDDMVASVLGQVSQLTGGSSQGSLLSQSRDLSAVSHLTADEMMMGTGAEQASGIPTFVAPSSAAAALQPEAAVAPSHMDAPSGPFGMPALNWGRAHAVPSIDEVAAPVAAPVLHLVAVEGVPSEQAPVAQAPVAQMPAKHSSASVDNPYLSGIDFGAKTKQEVAAPVVHAPAAQVSSNSDNPYLAGIDLGSKPSVPAKAVASTPSAPLDFNIEIAKISAPVAPARIAKTEASLSTESQTVRKGSNYLSDIGFSGILSGGSAAGNGDLRLFKLGDETPSLVAPVARPSFRKSASMIKETSISETDFGSSEEVLGKWLGHQEDDSEEAAKPQAPSEESTNPYMSDLN